MFRVLRSILLLSLIYSSGYSQVWKSIANAPSTLFTHGYTFGFMGKLYIGGGEQNTIVAFDPSVNKWSTWATDPGTDTCRGDGVAFVLGHKVYVGLGYDGYYAAAYAPGIWEYDDSTTNWTKKADFPDPTLVGMSSFVIDGKAYVGGGYDTVQGSDPGQFFEYDQANDTWIRKADIPSGLYRYAPTMFSIGHYGYVFGGENRMQYRDLYRYDPSTDTWTEMASLPGDPRALLASFVLHDIAYVGLGIYDPNDGSNSLVSEQDFYAYNPMTDSWSGPIMFPGTGRWGPLAASVGDTAYVGEGSLYPGQFFRNWWMFTSELNSVASRRTGSNVRVYPQPAGDHAYVSGLSGEASDEVQLFDMAGRRILQSTIAVGTNVDPFLDLSNVRPGVYQAVITDGTERHTLTILRQ